MTSIDNLRVYVFKHSKEPFIQLLNDNDVEFNEIGIPPGVIMAAGESLEIISKLADASFWVALSKVIVAFLTKGNSRRVYLQTKDNRPILLEGYSPAEIEKLLKASSTITAIDTGKET